MASGGFLSPPPSSIASSPSTTKPTLPRPRNNPLRPGGNKESTLIRYLDQTLLQIQRRFAKRKTASSLPNEELEYVKGYTSMTEICRDLDDLIDVIWISGSPSLQVPYLISVGLLVHTVVKGMRPLTPKSLLRLLGKLDYAFVGLLKGEDVETGERLAGVAGGRGVSGTEKVRIRSLAERTRIDVIEAFKEGEFEEEEKVETDESDGELVLEEDGYDPAEEMDDSWDMQLARVYDRTIVELGDSLEAPDIGIVTESRG